MITGEGPGAEAPGSGRTTRQRARPKPLDLLILAAGLAAFVVSAVTIYGGPASATVVISTDADEWVYPLGEDRTVVVEGNLGPVTVRVEGGRASFLDSPCENKTCIAAAPIGRTGEWSACLPSGVFMRIEGDTPDDEEFDAVVR